MSNPYKLHLPPFKPKFVFQTLAEQEIYDWGLQDLNIPDIHKQTQAEGIKIAIIDSGKSEHFEVAGAFFDAQNFSKSPTINDKLGHSTFISGLLCAAKNDQGIIGVAPKAKLLYAKAIMDDGQGDPDAIIRAFNWCVEQKVDIISISAGMFIDFRPLHDAVKKAYDNNIIIVGAVGNSSNHYDDIAFPARYPEVIGVAAYDRQRKPAGFSSRGINIKFAMPGVDIYSTYLSNTYCRMNGTSFACPIMTGICALILSKHRMVHSNTPCTNMSEMMEHLKKYAINLDGDQKAVGFGSVNVDGAIND